MDSPTSPSRRYTPISTTSAPHERQDSYTSYMSKHHYRLSSTTPSTAITNPFGSPTTVTNPVSSPITSGICSPTSTCSSAVTSPDLAPMPTHSTSFFATPATAVPFASRSARATSLDLPLPPRTTATSKPRHSSVTSISSVSSPIAPSASESSPSRNSTESARRYSAMTESFASLSPRHSVGSGRRWVRGASVDESKRERERERRVAEEMELERRFLGV